MAKLEILEFPDPRLRTIAKPVEQVDSDVQQLIDDMFETMYEAKGIGLAATQVNVHKQVVVMDLSDDEEESNPLVFINPEVTILDGAQREYDEGCLSVPGFYETVKRPEHITVKALDRDGNAFEMTPDGLLAVCIQHELDHLNGKLFVDHISKLKRERIRHKLEKIHRQSA